MSIKAIKSLSDFSFKDEINANENGLCLKNYYLPDEVVMYLLTFADGKDILNLSLVCKRWYVFVRSRTFWCVKYEREYRKKAKNLPWFVYYTLFATNFFDTNLLKNNCGKEGFNHWKINKNYGDAFKIEKVPFGCKPLPDVKDFDGYNSCFVTSYYECNKEQIIKFDGYKVFSVILDYYRPDIYVSEWVAGRSDCGCLYTLRCTLKSEADDILKEHLIKHRMEQRTNGDWKKVCFFILYFLNYYKVKRENKRDNILK